MKKISQIIVALICFLSIPLLSACVDKYEGMKVEVNVTGTVTVDLGDADPFVYVDATVFGCKQVCECNFSSTSKAIKITTEYLGDGVTRAKILGIEPCQTSVKVMTKENSMQTFFNVEVVRPVDVIALKDTAVTYKLINNTENQVDRTYLDSSLFTFEPDGSETQLEFKLNNELNNIEIQNNYLIVTGEITEVQTVSITATSVKQSDVATIFDFTLLPPIEIDSVEHFPDEGFEAFNSENQSHAGLLSNLSLEEGESVDYVLSLVRNNSEDYYKQITVDYQNLDNFEILPTHKIVGDLVTCTETSTDVLASVTEYETKFSAINLGKNTVIRFYGEYKNYPNTKVRLLTIAVQTRDEVTAINYSLEKNGDVKLSNDVEIYSNYGQGELGQRIYFEPYPTPVNPLPVKIVADQLTAQNYLFYDSTGTVYATAVSSLSFEIMSNEFIYVKAKDSTSDHGTISVSIEEITRELTLVPKVGAQDFDFKLETASVEEVFLTTNEEQSIDVTIETTPASTDFRGVTITTTGSGFTATLEGEVITITSIANSIDQTGTVRVTFPNKRSKVLNVSTFMQLVDENLKLTSVTQIQSSAVSHSELSPTGNLEKFILQNGNIVPLYLDGNGATIEKIEVEYKDGENTDFSPSSEVVNVSTTDNKYSLSANNDGVTQVKVKVFGYAFENGRKVETSFERIFMLEVFNPIRTIELDKYEMELYADDTLGCYDKAYAFKKIQAFINKEHLIAPTNYDLSWNLFSINDFLEIVKTESEEIEEYTFHAKTYDSNSADLTLILSATEKFKIWEQYGKTLSVSVKVRIKEAIKVDEIELRNIGKSGIYIDLTVDEPMLSYPILTNIVVKNDARALNSSLKYEFIPSAGTPTDILTISSDGLVQITSDEIGGSGHIKITPFDRYVEKSEGIVAENLNEKISLLIPVYVADGKSQATAKSISSLLSITSSTMHYNLVSNAYLSDSLRQDAIVGESRLAQILDNFNGGLYGVLGNDAATKATITLDNTNLFGTLGKNAVIKNLIFNGTAVGAGFIANENNGFIENCVVDTRMQNGKYSPSVLTANSQINIGGLVGINGGTVQNCQSFAMITADKTKSNVGGIAGSNTGIINASKVDFYTFENEDLKINHFTSKNVAGIAWTNSGSLTNNTVSNYCSDNKEDIFDCVTNSEICGSNTGTMTNNVFKQQSELSDYTVNTDDYKIASTSLSIAENENKAILFYYAPNETSLTVTELLAFRSLNTIGFEKLFNITRAQAQKIRVTSTNESIVSVSTNSINICGIGEVELKVFSKYNASHAKTISIYTCYYISDLFASVQGVRLYDGSAVNIKYGDVLTFKTNQVDSIIVVNRAIRLKQNSGLEVEFSFSNSDDSVIIENTSEIIASTQIGLHSFVVNETFIPVKTGKTFKVNFALLFAPTVSENFSNLLKNCMKGSFTVSEYNGAENVTVNVDKISFQPSDSQIVEVSFISDYTDGEGDNIDYTIRNGAGLDVSDYFDITKEVTVVDYPAKTGYKRYTFRLNISSNLEKIKLLSNDVLYNSGAFTMYVHPVSTQNVYGVEHTSKIEITLLPQDVSNITASHHLPESIYSYSTQGSVSYNYLSNNSLTPGTSGMLAVSLFPTYSCYDYITITSPKVSGYNVGLRLMTKVADNKYSDANINLYTRIDNGIRIDKNVIDLSQYSHDNNVGIFYIKTIISSEVDIDTNFDIIIQPYFNEVPTSTNLTFTLQTRYLDEAIILVNDKYNETYVAENCEAELKIIVPIDQLFSTSDVSIIQSDTDDEFELSSWSETVDYSKGLKTYISKLTVGTSEKYEISARVSWLVNGKYEVKQTTFTIHTLPFVLGGSSQLKVDGDNKTILTSYVDIKKELGFVFDASYNALNSSEYELFENQHYYKLGVGDSSYIVNNIDGFDYDLTDTRFGNWLYNLYFVSGNTETSALNNQNDYVSFIYNSVENKVFVLGKATGSVAMRFRMNIVYPNGINQNIEFDFTINVTVYTDEDLPRVIKSAKDFEDIEKENEAQDYILVDDIELFDYKPTTTAKINSLDGNNKSIIIRSFAEPEENETSINYALFSNVESHTLLKNVTVNYHYLNNIVVDTGKITDINIAGLALSNSGLIYNCEVIAYKLNSIESQVSNFGISVRYTGGIIDQSINSNVAGFVLNNQQSGSITNSRVGGRTKIEVVNDEGQEKTVNLQPLCISAQGNIAGFVYNNEGNISSSSFDNAYILNNSASDYTTVTAGFVAYNKAGQVVMSYARGVYQDLVEIHATRYGISTVGISAGFVYSNEAKISDCYSNIRLINSNVAGRASAGFVYINGENGKIEKCFSASQIMFNTTTQMNFSGVGDNQEYLNEGEILNCYYFDENVQLKANNTVEAPAVEEYYNSPAIRINIVSNAEAYYGFAFTSDGGNDGVWEISSRGPELVEANNIAISARIHKEIEGKETYTLNYVDSYRYGSEKNPIIIRDATEFNEVFGGSNRTVIKEYYDTQKHTVFGNYRLVNNINFEKFSKDVVLNSSKMELTQVKDISGKITGYASLEGNGLKISNISMSASRDINDSFGLFKSIKNGAIVKNLNIVLGKVDNAESSIVYGISAGDVKCVGILAGTIEDSTLININVSALEGQNSVKVEGQNLVGGIAGKVVGKIRLNGISAHNISVKALQTSVVYYYRTANENRYSYAGGLFAVLDLYKSVDQTLVTTSDLLSTSNVLKLRVTGSSTIEGAVVGGVVGYVGVLTQMQDVLYELGSAAENQKLVAYNNGYAGGIAGINCGILNQARTEHNTALQQLIEDSIDTYYSTSSATVNKGNETLFYNSEYSPLYIGGLVGYQESGKLIRSYSKINVKNKKATSAGGLIGYAKTTVEAIECFTTADVFASKYIGGIIGYSSVASVDLHLVNALNYWDKNLLTNYSENNSLVITTETEDEQEYKVVKGDIGAICPSISIIKTDNNALISKLNLITKVKFNYQSKFEEYSIQLSKHNITNTKNSQGLTCDISEDVDTSYTYLEGKQDRIEKASYVFSINENDWNSNKWQRDANQPLPSMKFVVTGDVYFINVAKDIELMNIYSNATFIITRMVDFENYENSSFRVSYFTGTLKGKDDVGDYGFKNLKLNNPLFTNAYGARFLGFKITNDKTNSDAYTYKSSVLIKNARSVEIVNVEFENIKVKFGDSDSDIGENVGVIVENFTGGKNLINAITFKGLSFELSTSKNVNAGLVFGSSTVGNLIIKNVNVIAKEETCSIKAELKGGSEKISNIGLIGGYVAGNLKYEYSSVSLDENVVDARCGVAGEIKVEGADGKGATSPVNVGALVGSVGGIFETNLVNVEGVDINVNASANANVGGFAGSANIIQLGNTALTHQENYPSIINVTVSGSKTVICNVGGFVGHLTGSASFLNVSFDKTSKIEVITNNTGKNSNINIGGSVGLYEYAKLKVWNSSNHEGGVELFCNGSITVNKGISYNNASNFINLGGIVGKLTASEDESSLVFKDTVSFVDIKIGALGEAEIVHAGGIIGSAECALAENLTISDNYSAGNYFVDASIKEYSDTPHTLFIGGICGYSQTVPTKNKCLFTLMNTTGRYYSINEDKSKTYQANAIVGAFDSELEITQLSDEHINLYSSSVCLMSDSVMLAKNVNYSTMLKRHFNKVNDQQGGKLKPYTSENEIDTQKITVDKDVLTFFSVTSEEKTFEANCSMLDVGQNIFLAFDEIVVTQNGDKSSLFNAIGKNSVISGLNYCVHEFDYGSTDAFGILANLNNGIIFGCSTTKIDQKTTIIVNPNISAFVYENNGFINQSFSNVDIKSNQNAYGFVATGYGVIDSCYSAGRVDGLKNTAFGVGKAVNCYTISQINRKNSAPSMEIFGSEAKQCYYEQTALQYKSDKENQYTHLDINLFALDFIASNENDVSANVKTKFNDPNSSVWSSYKDYNYGFPVLNCAGYSEVYQNSYDNINATTQNLSKGEGIEAGEAIYLIGSLGKLEQIESLKNGKFIIFNDLYGGFTSRKNNTNYSKYPFTSITDFTGTISGSTIEIKYNTNAEGEQVGEPVPVKNAPALISDISLTKGIFTSSSGQISDINLQDINVIGENDAQGIITQTMQGGTIEKINVLNGTIIVSSATTFGTIAGEMTGGSIENVLNQSDISSENNSSTTVGGVVGKISGDANVSKCFNIGKIENKSENVSENSELTFISGGIVGLVTSGTGSISECMNRAINDDKGIVLAGDNYALESYAGGIAGKIDSINFKIENCYNAGLVKAVAFERHDSSKDVIIKEPWKTTSRKGESRYGLFIMDAYAGGIVAETKGEINTAYNTKNYSSENSSVIGGYEIFKPYYLQVKTDNTLNYILGGITAVAAIAMTIASFGTAGVAISLVKAATTIALNGTLGFGLGFFGAFPFSTELFAEENVARPSDRWTSQINNVDSRRDDVSFGELLYKTDYQTAFVQSGVSEKFIAKYDPIAEKSGNKYNCEFIQGSVEIEQVTPSEFASVELVEGEDRHKLTLEDIGVFNNFNGKTYLTKDNYKYDGEITDVYWQYSKISSDVPTHIELSAYDANQNEVSEMVSKEECIGDSQDFSTVWEIHNQGNLILLSRWFNSSETARNFDGHIFRLMNDIQLTCENWTPIKNFKATFDGNGHAIVGANIVSKTENIGFFENTVDATIKDLTLLSQISIEDTTTDVNNVGGLVGYAQNTKIENCAIQTDAKIINAEFIGGIAGKTDGGEITKCLTKGEILSYVYNQDTTLAGFVANVENETKVKNSEVGSILKSFAIGDKGDISENNLKIEPFAPETADIDDDCRITLDTYFEAGARVEYPLEQSILNSDFVIVTKNANLNKPYEDFNSYKIYNEIEWTSQSPVETISHLEMSHGYNKANVVTETISTGTIDGKKVMKKTLDINMLRFSLTPFMSSDAITETSSMTDAEAEAWAKNPENQEHLRYMLDVYENNYQLELFFTENSLNFEMYLLDIPDRQYGFFTKTRDDYLIGENLDLTKTVSSIKSFKNNLTVLTQIGIEESIYDGNGFNNKLNTTCYYMAEQNIEECELPVYEPNFDIALAKSLTLTLKPNAFAKYALRSTLVCEGTFTPEGETTALNKYIDYFYTETPVKMIISYNEERSFSIDWKVSAIGEVAKNEGKITYTNHTDEVQTEDLYKLQDIFSALAGKAMSHNQEQEISRKIFTTSLFHINLTYNFKTQQEIANQTSLTNRQTSLLSKSGAYHYSDTNNETSIHNFVVIPPSNADELYTRYHFVQNYDKSITHISKETYKVKSFDVFVFDYQIEYYNATGYDFNDVTVCSYISIPYFEIGENNKLISKAGYSLVYCTERVITENAIGAIKQYYLLPDQDAAWQSFPNNDANYVWNDYEVTISRSKIIIETQTKTVTYNLSTSRYTVE